MFTCGGLWWTSRAGKNSNRKALFTIIIMLLQLYHATFRALAYLIPVAYSNPYQIHKMIIYIENPGIVRTVAQSFFSIFFGIQQYPAMVRHTEQHWGIFRHIKALLSHIQAYSELYITLAYTAVPYSEHWHINNWSKSIM